MDACDPLTELRENNTYILYTIRKFFFFGDQNSHNTFINAFTLFKANNTQDKHQLFTHTLDITIPDFAVENGIGVTGTGGSVNCLYILFLLFGFGWAYLIIIECISQRYTVNVTKRLTI